MGSSLFVGEGVTSILEGLKRPSLKPMLGYDTTRSCKGGTVNQMIILLTNSLIKYCEKTAIIFMAIAQLELVKSRCLTKKRQALVLMPRRRQTHVWKQIACVSKLSDFLFSLSHFMLLSLIFIQVFLHMCASVSSVVFVVGSSAWNNFHSRRIYDEVKNERF